jgi:type VI protein secretion system component Hcp
MAFSAFLKLGDIVGESSEPVPLETFSWGVSNPASFCAEGGRPSFQDFSFTSRLGPQSPNLFLACATARHIKVAILTIPQIKYEVVFTNLIISNYKEDLSFVKRSDGDGSVVPVEVVSFNYGKVEVTLGRETASFDICRGT